MVYEQRDVFPFPFADGRFPPDLGGVIQRTVADGALPALTVVHDEDGYWHLLDGINDPNLPEACGLYSIAHIADEDPAIQETATLPPGYAAYREAPGQPWSVEPFAYEDEDTPSD